MITTGSPSFDCPMSIDADEANSSAIPTSVTSKVLPYKSFCPRRSDKTDTPLQPIAIPTIPFLQALPVLSLIITPTFFRKNFELN